MFIQPSVVGRLLTLFIETTPKVPHYSSHARCRIAVALFHLPEKLLSGSVRAAGLVVQERHRAKPVAYSHRNPPLDAGALDLLEKVGQIVCGRTVLMESRIPERAAEECFRCLATVVTICKG